MQMIITLLCALSFILPPVTVTTSVNIFPPGENPMVYHMKNILKTFGNGG
jgi:hypothetical protein